MRKSPRAAIKLSASGGMAGATLTHMRAVAYEDKDGSVRKVLNRKDSLETVARLKLLAEEKRNRKLLKRRKA